MEADPGQRLTAERGFLVAEGLAGPPRSHSTRPVVFLGRPPPLNILRHECILRFWDAWEICAGFAYARIDSEHVLELSGGTKTF